MGKRKAIIRKSVAFNVADPYQRKLLEHTAQFTNFSAYMKRLIQRDMEGGGTITAEAQSTITDAPKISADLLNGLI
jgi:hypothetical protein